MNLIFFAASLLVSQAFHAPANIPPTANAGEKLVVDANDYVQLDGTASVEPDGIISRYHWVQTAGAPIEIVNPFAAITALNKVSKGIYNFRLTVMDERGGIGTDEVTVIVK